MNWACDVAVLQNFGRTRTGTDVARAFLRQFPLL
jgi:hypothetical protein